MKTNSRLADWLQVAYFGFAALIFAWMLWQHAGLYFTKELLVIQYELYLLTLHYPHILTAGYIVTAAFFLFCSATTIAALLSIANSRIMRGTPPANGFVRKSLRALALVPLLGYGYFSWYQICAATYYPNRVVLPCTSAFASMDRQLFWSMFVFDASVAEVDFGPYMQDLERKLKKNWSAPPSSVKRIVVTQFWLTDQPSKTGYATDSKMNDLKLISGSGDPDTDEAALKAVRTCPHFRGLPAGSSPSVPITFSFTSGPKD